MYSVGNIRPPQHRTLFDVLNQVASLMPALSSMKRQNDLLPLQKQQIQSQNNYRNLISQVALNKANQGINKLVPTAKGYIQPKHCLLYTSPSPRDRTRSRMPSSA